MNCELHLCSDVLGHLWEHMQRTFPDEWCTGNGLMPNDIALTLSTLCRNFSIEIHYHAFCTSPKISLLGYIQKTSYCARIGFLWIKDKLQTTVAELNPSRFHRTQKMADSVSFMYQCKSTPLKKTAWNLEVWRKKFHTYKFLIIPQTYEAAHACSDT